jgi:hypothetical protein
MFDNLGRRIRRAGVGACFGAACVCLLGSTGDSRSVAGRATSPEAGAAVVAATAAPQPLRFEPNRGQFDDRVRFLARGHGYGVYLMAEGATLALDRAQEGDGSERAVVGMRLRGARTDVRPIPSDQLPGATNYFVGADSSKWRAGVEGYARVRYPEVLPGVDVVYYGAGRELEYDLALAPGVDPESVVLQFDGVERVDVDADGNAVLHVSGDAALVQRPPVAYQQGRDGTRTPVAARYAKRGDDTLALVTGERDDALPLVVDPVLGFSSYLGGSADEQGFGIAADASGAYVTGYTTSHDFPTLNPIEGRTTGSTDIFVTKVTAAGALVYSTYLGGSGGEMAHAIAVDPAGKAYVTGETFSQDFPIAPAGSPAIGDAPGHGAAFMVELNAAGSQILYSNYLGGTTGATYGYGVAVDAAGDVGVTGWTTSSDFPSQLLTGDMGVFRGFPQGGSDAFAFFWNNVGGSLDFGYWTYIGGSGNDYGNAIALDENFHAFIVGSTASTNFLACANQPGTGGCTNFPAGTPGSTLGGSADAFVHEINRLDGITYFSRYLGGSDIDFATGVAVDATGAYIVGSTNSTDYPIAAARYPTNHGDYDAFVTKLVPGQTGGTLVYSTYLGGSSQDGAGGAGGGGLGNEGAGNGIAVDAAGRAYVTGYTASTNFPTASPLYATNQGGTWDAFVTQFSPDGSQVGYSTYLGGNGQDLGMAIAVSGTTAYVTGQTLSTSFPVLSAFQPSSHGGFEAFVTRLDSSALSVDVVSSLQTGASATCNGAAGTGLAYSGTANVFAVDNSGSVNTNQDWRWVLALLYGGRDYSTNAAPDCNSAARRSLVSSWSRLFQNGCANNAPVCGTGSAVNGALWRAFRLDDSSPVSAVFADLIGLTPSPSSSALNGFGKSPFCNAMNWETSSANNNCSLGAHKQWVGPGGVLDPVANDGVHRRPPPGTWGDAPDPSQGALGADVLPTQFQDNDPIRNPCLGGGTNNPSRAGEEVCNIDGKLGVVLPIPDISWMPASLRPYPTNSCNTFAIGKAPTVFTCAIRGNGTKHSGECPNGDALFAAGCLLPIDSVNGTSQCVATKATVAALQSRNLGFPDGRIYNIHMRDGTTAEPSIGYAQYPVPGTSTLLDFVGGYGRIHEVERLEAYNNTFATHPCQEPETSDQIGCLMQADPCSVGFADDNATVWGDPPPTTGAVRVNQLLPGNSAYPL